METLNDKIARGNKRFGKVRNAKFYEGDEVRITGPVADKGKKGIIKAVTPEGKFFVVEIDGKTKSFHESDLGEA